MKRPVASSHIAPTSGASISPEYLLSLRERLARDRHKVFLGDGWRFVHAALDASAPIQAVVVCQELLGASPPCVWQRLRPFPWVQVTAAQFRELAASPEPQGIALVVHQNTLPLSEVRLRPRATWVGIEGIRTPGNLGTILRTMRASGADGIVCFGNRGASFDIFDPGVVRASMGAIFGCQIVRATYREFALWRLRGEIRVFGTACENSVDYRQVRLSRAVMIMLGNERSGLSPGQLSACDAQVRIPMSGDQDSLNVAVAAGILLYEAFGQKRSARMEPNRAQGRRTLKERWP